ncbi:hypothetical protein Dsin_013616 [Dipteronia sinensis]|uniref:Proteasome alpha-type subunits domain-containing protein n=1 Tax=Dipteronia sinensis TaxID=43782 RepID=A0AAE0AKG7_9ROSI|nr:hypothetical protein Dsin_013616 [Dipteronia sinensis]
MSSIARYDRAITVFSPDGHLLQVEYALEAFRKGNTVRGSDIFVLDVEKKSTAKLQDSRNLIFDTYVNKYTQSGGVRHLSTLIVGFDLYTAWKANATRRNSNSIREFLEKSYKETSGQETVKLAIRALLEVVESGGKNKEVAMMMKDDGPKQLEEAEIDAIVTEIEAEKAAAEAAKKGPPKET